MSIALTSLVVRHERRLRLTFTNTLAGGAFGAPAPTYYSVVCADGRSPDPAVQAALLVSGSPSVVELTLGSSLVKGVIYTVSAIGVPSTDSSMTGSDAVLSLRWGLQQTPLNVEPTLKDKRRFIYGVDLLWTGVDFQETATGDLDRVDGTANVTKALNRRVECEPGDLPWDTTYGAGVRDFVDSPSSAAGTLQGTVSAQLLRDRRVKSLKINYEIADEVTYLYVDPTLVSGESLERISIGVPNE